jgi:hypothetical protein
MRRGRRNLKALVNVRQQTESTRQCAPAEMYASRPSAGSGRYFNMVEAGV